MNLEGIEAFLAVVKLRSFSKAAQQLFVSQPTLSNRIKALEAELNVTLIRRQKGIRTIVPTYHGEQFIPIAEQWLSLYKDTVKLQDTKSTIELHIGCPDTLMSCFLPKLFERLLQLDPPIYLKLLTYHSEELYQALTNHKIDVGLGFYRLYYENILIKPVFKEKWFLIRKRGKHPTTTTVHPSELDRKKEIYFYWCPEFQQWHDTMWEPNTKPHVEIDTASLLRHFLHEPGHWAIIPYCVASAYTRDPDFEICHIEEGPPERVCYQLVHRYPRPHHTKGIKIFLSMFKQFCNEQSWDIKI